MIANIRQHFENPATAPSLATIMRSEGVLPTVLHFGVPVLLHEPVRMNRRENTHPAIPLENFVSSSRMLHPSVLYFSSSYLHLFFCSVGGRFSDVQFVVAY